MDFDSYPQFEIEGDYTAIDKPTLPLMEKHGLRSDWLRSPRPDRLPPDRPDAEACHLAHQRAVDNNSLGYADPGTGLFVMTAVYLRDRGWCCDRGCRHCPYEPMPDTANTDTPTTSE